MPGYFTVECQDVSQSIVCRDSIETTPKISFSYIATIADFKIKNVTEFESIELSVKQCPTDIPDNYWAMRENRNHLQICFHDTSQATGQTMGVMLHWQFKICGQSSTFFYPAVSDCWTLAVKFTERYTDANSVMVSSLSFRHRLLQCIRTRL